MHTAQLSRIIRVKAPKAFILFLSFQYQHISSPAYSGGLRKPGQGIHELIQSEFTEEALGNLEGMENQKEQLEDDLDLLFAHGQVVYKG